MKNAVIVVGMGEMGGVFARGFLKLGHPVYPINRDDDINSVKNQVPEPQAVIAAVGEKDLAQTLSSIPGAWQDRLVLLQNELLPKDWQAHNIASPTVISAWFEKKKPQDFKVIIPSPIFGPQANLIKSALESIKIPCQVLKSEEDLVSELVIKNLYILTVNIAGLEVGGTVGELWNQHNDLARAVANDILDIQFKLIGKELDRELLIEGMVKAFEGDMDHKCMGRSAPSRLERAVSQADELGVKASRLREIQGNHIKTAA